MRYFALLATIYAAALGTTSALVDASVRTTVGVSATDYDHSTLANGGCDPAGCVPEYTRDSDLAATSRWSCEGDGCCITYTFEEAQDIVKLKIAFHKGSLRTRTMNVHDNGDYHSQITSSGTTLGYEIFYLYTDETDDLKLCHEIDDDDDEWLSLTEVRPGTFRC